MTFLPICFSIKFGPTTTRDKDIGTLSELLLWQVHAAGAASDKRNFFLGEFL